MAAVVTAPAAARNYWRQVYIDTLSPITSRLGIGWIGAIAILAVFAPFLANSEPLLLKSGGHISSPAVAGFSASDVTLLALAGWVVILRIRRASFARSVLELLILLALVLPVTFAYIKPPEVVVWQKYRDLNRRGKIEWQLLAPIPYSPEDYQRDVAEAELQPPSRHHWLGTDSYGGDIASRMLYGCRIALTIGILSQGIAVVIGITVGGLMGYFAGAVDLFGMRLIEIFESIPTLFLLITIVALFKPDLYSIMIVIGLTGWTGEARFIRAEYLRLRTQDFVQAATANGLPLWSILMRHMLPNGIYPILVTSSFGVAGAILAESTLSFLGIGLAQEASWGAMLSQAESTGGTFVWWIALFPGLAIFLTVFSYNLIGEALRDALDPKLQNV